ncbi:MAG TPA: response regulator transcription factor [Vicinamibacteria bacterium]|nr:response regulator transcription factor [Vicinamibacteria bacterium]
MAHGIPIRVLVVDDHPLVRQGVVAVVAAESDMAVVGEAGDGRQAVALFRKVRPDVALIDLGLPLLDGIGAMEAIRSEFPGSRFIALTVYQGDEDVHRALQAGAQAYLLKNAPSSQLVAAIRAVHAGLRKIPPEVASLVSDRGPGPGLTVREIQVLRLVAKGRTNLEIAEELQITRGTAKWFVSSILSKLGVGDRTEAVTMALERGILH